MTPYNATARAPIDSARHDARLRMLRMQIRQLRIFELKKSFQKSIGTIRGNRIEELLHYKTHDSKWVPSHRSKLPDRQLAGAVEIGLRSLRKYELISPGISQQVRHVLFDLLEKDSGWTLPHVWKCMQRMPASVTSALFYDPTSEGARWTHRRQLSAIEINDLGCRLSKKDHLAFLVALFREQQVIGDAQKCLELRWALEDTIHSRKLMLFKCDERILQFAIENSVMCIAWDRQVLMNNLKTMTARIAKSLNRLRQVEHRHRNTLESAAS